MSSNLAVLPEPEPLRAVTISRDVQDFDLLIEDMESELGEGWGDLDFREALAFLRQDDARDLEFVVVATDRRDEADLSTIGDVVRQSKRIGLSVILVADGLSPGSLQELVLAGTDDYVPYPLAEKALNAAITRIRGAGGTDSLEIMRRAGADRPAGRSPDPSDAEAAPEPVGSDAPEPDAPQLPAIASEATAGTATGRGGTSGEGAIFAVQSAAGGNGATTVAVNLAWELANLLEGDETPRVCLIDLGLQFGSVATYLDLDRKPMILEVLSDVASMDEQAFRQAMSHYRERLDVFTAPADILPLDLIGPDEVRRLLNLARGCYDVVVLDMPGALTGWTDAVLAECDLFFMVTEMDIRSAHNTMRFQKLLKAEGIATARLSYVLNRAPGKMGARGRIDKLAESLGVKFHAILPDGGRPVTDANDQARPLRDAMPRNPLTKEIAKMAKGLDEARQSIAAGETSETKPARKKAFLGLSFG